MHPSQQSNARFHAAGLFVILLLVVICVWPAMQSPLFSDDIHQLDKSSNFVKWTEIFNPDVFGFYRPVKNLLFMLLAPVSENLLAWHMVGLVAYLAATAGIYRIASICLDSPRAAWLAAALWALSPSCVSTVVWLSCANISIGLVFTSLVFHFHERWAVRGSTAAIVACGFFYGMSLLCYETLIAAPALLFLRDFQMRRLAFDRRTAARYALYTIVALAFLLVRHHFSARNIGDVSHRIGFTEGTTGVHLSLSAPWFLWRHFLMWVFPFGQLEILGNYGWMRSAPLASIIMSWVFLAALLATAALTWKRFPAIGYGILFFIVASIPSGNFIPCFNGPINDAYVTIPSIGLAIALASVCDNLYKQFLLRRNGLKSGALAFAAVLAVLLVYRLPVGAAYFRYWAGVWKQSRGTDASHIRSPAVSLSAESLRVGPAIFGGLCRSRRNHRHTGAEGRSGEQHRPPHPGARRRFQKGHRAGRAILMDPSSAARGSTSFSGSPPCWNLRKCSRKNRTVKTTPSCCSANSLKAAATTIRRVRSPSCPKSIANKAMLRKRARRSSGSFDVSRSR